MIIKNGKCTSIGKTKIGIVGSESMAYITDFIIQGIGNKYITK
jgi:hypothetical protein